jgi:hypothetical protein
METPDIQPDVYDPATDLRHRPAAEPPAADPTVPKPRNPDSGAVPPDEPVVVPPVAAPSKTTPD